MDRSDLVQHYVTLMGSDAEEKGFYKELASMTNEEIVQAIINVAYYYKDEFNNL